MSVCWRSQSMSDVSNRICLFSVLVLLPNRNQERLNYSVYCQMQWREAVIIDLSRAVFEPYIDISP